MSLIHIKRDHMLTREQAREKLEAIAQSLEDEFDLEHRWDGNILRFERSGAKGVIGIGKDSVEIKIKLGVSLLPIKGKIEKQILANLDELAASG